jgi:hypothetical protein
MHPNTEQLLNYSLIVHMTNGGHNVDKMACGILYEELGSGYYLVATAGHTTLLPPHTGALTVLSNFMGRHVANGITTFHSTQFDVAFVLYRGPGLPTNPLIGGSTYEHDNSKPTAIETEIVFPGPPRSSAGKPFASFIVHELQLEYRKFKDRSYGPAFQGPIKNQTALVKKGWTPVWCMDLPSRPGCSGGILATVHTGQWWGMIGAGNTHSPLLEGHGYAAVLTPAQIHAARREVEPQVQKFLKSVPR